MEIQKAREGTETERKVVGWSREQLEGTKKERKIERTCRGPKIMEEAS